MRMLTASTLRWLHTCQRRVWRDVHLEHPPQEKPGLFTTVLTADAPVQRTVVAATWEEGVRLTHAAMQEGVESIAGGYVEAVIDPELFEEPIMLGGRVDRLVRQPDGLYAPVDILREAHVSEADVLRLELYLWILCKLQGVDMLPAAFVLSEQSADTEPEWFEHTYDEARFVQQLAAILHMVAEDEPDVQLIGACKTCHWKPDCYPVAQSHKHVSLLSKLRADTRADLAAKGIHRLDQIVAMHPDELRMIRGIKSGAQAIHASARAWIEEGAIWYGKLHPSCRVPAAFFDIETLKNERGVDEVWSIGWCGLDGRLQLVVVAPVDAHTTVMLPNEQVVNLAPSAEEAWRIFARDVAGTDSPVFHWSPYDAGVMRRTAPDEAIQILGTRLRDLCKLFDDAVKIPVKGVSLKVVAPYFGFNWHGYEDWFAAYMDYRRWLITSDLAALASACAYQRDDVEAMVVIQRWLAEHAPS
ncbi:MAG: TM0106 family RecB-like putative nuclease [Anaerolineae bacterium]|nr:TM0106 family RecB-like putative nuclease [Anaerolineae bacterium]